jgi:uncharacterized protein YjdB
MSLMWLDDLDVESAEYDDSESPFDDAAESDDSESRDARRRRQAQQRRVALARRRQAMARSRAMPGPARPGAALAPVPAQRQTVAAIRELDLETKVGEDKLRAAITAQRKRMTRSEYAAVLGAVTNQAIESFDGPDNPYLKAGLRFAPLLLLSPQKQGSGVDAFVRDPRVVGAGLVLGITFAADTRNRFTKAQDISILASAELEEGENDVFFAEVTDGRGRPVATEVTWSSSDPSVASIDAKSGAVVALRPSTVTISASAGGITRRVRLKVRARSSTISDDGDAAGNAKHTPEAGKGKLAPEVAKTKPPAGSG